MEKFVVKTAEELEKMTAEELAGYYNEKNAADKKELESLIEGKATKEEIDALKAAINENIEKQMEQINGILKHQGVMITKLSKEEKPEGMKSVREILADNAEKLQALKNGSREAISFSTKVVGPMLISTNVTGEVPQAQREPGLNVIATRMPVVQDLISMARATSNVVSWVEQQNKEGGAGGTAEGALKNQADFDLVVAEETIKKRTVYIKVSEEMIEDIDFMTSEINNELLRLLNLDIEDQLLNGDGTGTNLNGILTQATAFSAGTFAGAIDEANNWDVLKVAINQIMLAHFMPSVILMNPSDVTAMNLTKGTDGHYVLPPFTSAEGLQVSGIRIVPSTVIAADNYLVMDGSRATAFWKNDIRVEVGYENDDFTKNMRTILAEARLLLRIKGNDTTAFVKGVFTTDKAALETP